MKADLKRAGRELTVFFRTAATDKCFLPLFGLVAIGVVLIIVWHVWLEEYLRKRNFNPLRIHEYTATPVFTRTPKAPKGP